MNAHKLDKMKIPYRMQDNAFLEISNIETAQKHSDRITPKGLYKFLNVFAKRYSLAPESLGLGYTVHQVECAANIMFRRQKDLKPLYDEITRLAISTFHRQRIIYKIGTNYKQCILGTRIKKHIGDVSIKMYAKLGRVLQIESIYNDISMFYVEQEA